jgi:hypothetical protein
MHYQRPGVYCRFCGQPIVIQDAQAGELAMLTAGDGSLYLLCMSCGRVSTHGLHQFHTFESAELASGDWELIIRDRNYRPDARRPG